MAVEKRSPHLNQLDYVSILK